MRYLTEILGGDDMPKLTKRFIESIVPDPQKPLKYWDDEVSRFGVVILPSGRRTYCIEYRNANHVQKRVKIGVHGQITLEEARNLAKIKLSYPQSNCIFTGGSNFVYKHFS